MIALMFNVVEHLQRLVPVITITGTNPRSQIVIYKKKTYNYSILTMSSFLYYIYSFFRHSSIIHYTGQKF